MPSSVFLRSCVGEHHPPLEGVDDASVMPRRRPIRKIQLRDIGEREAGPSPKRWSWLLLPGPSRDEQEDGHIPRVGVGWTVDAAWDCRNRFSEA